MFVSSSHNLASLVYIAFYVENGVAQKATTICYLSGLRFPKLSYFGDHLVNKMQLIVIGASNDAIV